MKIIVTSVLVDDQEKALDFYTRVLGFRKKTDIPAGGGRWLTVVSPDVPDGRDGPHGVELALEPLGFPPAMVFQTALREAGIPWTMFGVADAHREHERLESLGVVFTMPPTEMGPVTMAMLEDTCGNLIQIVQE
jgi:catechol 2,3-dioxygenase-like lactoylglutathione lyase family enzyme